MLQEMRIRNLGVIEDAFVEFSPGLNVVTGETGAGKTMVVQGLGLLLGGRADPGLVREGHPKAIAEGVLDLPDGHPARLRAVEAGADDAPGEPLLLARTVAEQGRSRATVGGRNAPVAVLSDIGQLIVAVHGQSDQWRLQRPEEHLAVLDEFGAAPLRRARSTYESLYARWRQVGADLAVLRADRRERALRRDQLESALEEIAAVEPAAGEDEQLAAEAERLTHLDLLREAVATAHEALVGSDEAIEAPSAIALAGAARNALAQASAHDSDLAALHARAAEISVLVTELAADVAAAAADLDLDPGRLEFVQTRRAQLAGLTRKYGESIAEVLAWSQQAAAEAATLAGDDDRVEELAAQHDRLSTELAQAATQLTAQRTKAAGKLGTAVTRELKHLAMGSAVVTVEVTGGQEPGPTGADRVEILLAANKGARTRPIAKAASGGELSRVMLALEVVTADGSVPTFVFDEVDAGVGGSAAIDIGLRLQALARHSQVLVVTHLAQVAAFADRQLVVHKRQDGQVTRSDIEAVEGDARVKELARMLGGDANSAAAQAHARELLDRAATTLPG